MNTVVAVQQVLLHSGAAWVLWLLGLLSLASTVVIVERWLLYRARGGDLEGLASRLGARLADRDLPAALRELASSPSVAAAIAAAGLRLADHGPAAVERAMKSATALERSRLERWLAYLGTLGNNAPFIGLFGTVIGVIGAFEELGRVAPGPAAAAAQLASQAVMARIAEALVATAVGILVALPAVAAFNYFQRRTAALLAGTDALSNLVLAYLSDGRRAATDGHPSER